MVIVGGWFTVEPSEREAFVAGQAEAIRRSRAGVSNTQQYVVVKAAT